MKNNINNYVELLVSTGLFKQIFGNEIQQSQIARRDWGNIRTMGEFLFMLMNGVVQNPVEFYLSRFSSDDAKRDKINKEIQALSEAFNSELVDQQMSPVKARSVAHNMYRLAPQTLESKILPQMISNAGQELLQGKYPKTVGDLVVNGNDLMQKGLSGKDIGDSLKSMLINVYADKVKNDKESLLALVGNNSDVQEGYDTYSKTQTWNVNDKLVSIDFFVDKYDKWNNQGGEDSGYSDASKSSVLEFIQNNYEDFSHDEKLKRELYWALTDRDLLGEEVTRTEKVEYGALMLFFDIAKWDNFLSTIESDDVYKINNEFGLETEPHVTILYGFNSNVNNNDVFDLYKENFELKPIEINVDGISIFENDEFDVIKMDVNSKTLTKMNSVMSNLSNTKTYPNYHTHITLAYVKKGRGIKYVMDFEKKVKLIGNKLVFSTKKEKTSTLNLLEKGLLKEEVTRKVSYSAVVLDDTSRDKLIKVFKGMVPEGWEVTAHHMTIKLGGLENNSNEKNDMGNNIIIDLDVVDYAYDDKVFAVGVKGYSTTNVKPHITIAVNRKNGGKPFMSNKLTDWKPIDFSLKLTGSVEEIGVNSGSSLNESTKKKSKYVKAKDSLMNSKSINSKMKELINKYMVSGSKYIDGGFVHGLSKPQKLREKSSKINGVSMGADKNGFFVYTHRARSKSKPTPEQITVIEINFIESTG